MMEGFDILTRFVENNKEKNARNCFVIFFRSLLDQFAAEHWNVHTYNYNNFVSNADSLFSSALQPDFNILLIFGSKMFK